MSRPEGGLFSSRLPWRIVARVLVDSRNETAGLQRFVAFAKSRLAAVGLSEGYDDYRQSCPDF